MSIRIRHAVPLCLGVLFLCALNSGARELGFPNITHPGAGRRWLLFALCLCLPALAAAANTYSSAGARSTDRRAVQSTEIWHASGSVWGQQFITVNFSGATGSGTCMAAEFSNVAVDSPVDAVATVNNGAASTSPFGAAVTTTSDSDLVIGAISGGVTDVDGDSSFASLQSVSGNAAAWLNASSADVYQPHWDGDNVSFAASTVAYRSAGSTPQLVQSAAVEMGSGSDTQCTITMNPTGPGNLIVVITSIASTSTVVATVTDAPSTVTNGSIDLSWDPSDSPDVVAYNVYRSIASGEQYIRVGQVTGTAFTDNNVNQGMTYFYVVTAVDRSGEESLYSDEVSGTVSP